MAQSKPPTDRTPFLDMFRRLLAENQRTVKVAQENAGIVGGQIDASHLTGKVSGDTLRINKTDVPNQVALTGLPGMSDDPPPWDHVHPHGTQPLLPDAHHDESHGHNGDGSGLVSHDVLLGVSANDHHDEVHALLGGDHTISGGSTGDVLTKTGPGTAAFQAPATYTPTTRWEPLTNSDPTTPEIIFLDGDVVMVEVPL